MSHRKSLESPSSAVSRYSLGAYSTKSNGDDRGSYDKLELGDLSNTHLLSATAYDPYRGSSRASKARSISSLSAASDWTLKSKGKAFLDRARSTFGISKNVSRNERENTRPGHGLWSELMLVDRTLRGMAALTSTFAVVMIVICVVYAKDFTKHMESLPNSTSVTISSGSDSDRKAEAYKFLINVAATMILGMSNTYQQLLTALTVDDLKHALYKYGDARVGTNSPFSIKHKRDGRLRAWLAWILLICTSMPVHLLANSVIGVSDYYGVRLNVHYHPEDNATSNSSYSFGGFDCYSALRTGQARLDPTMWEDALPGSSYADKYYTSASLCPANHSDPNNPFDASNSEETVYTDITVYYEPGSACSDLVNQSVPHDEVWDEWESGDYSNNYTYFGGCSGRNFTCHYSGNSTVEGGDRQGHHVRLVLRMQAAIILAVCISIKAAYMVAVNVRNRHQIKTHCLTFGDVLVASNFDADLRIPSESMVNGGDFHRRAVSHTCHKHCKSTQLSDTGEELGHCQKCKKHNTVNNCPGLPWPSLSTKRKKSLITNLGQTALTQMLTLSFCSVGMVAASIFIAIIFTSQYAYAVCVRWTTYNEQFAAPQTFASMAVDSLWGEIAAFLISNGAQLLYSCLYLLLIYNVTLICMEHQWGKFEKGRQRLRCTIVKSERFDESYFLQLPKKILFPIMVYSVLMHWLLGLAILAKEEIVDDGFVIYSRYNIVTVPDGVWGSCALLLAMTSACWWAYTYRREGFIPQMFGSIRALCASTSNLSDFPMEGIHWGDLGTNETSQWRHAGLSEGEVGEIVPNELYA
ncbi:hypothetical protein DBV05_g8912 [Lasiodiplodia theobromae]|uniref:DUF6536 domain-containing protein n=1 Tax=Lasiodiplodia theobromae TaxID=45133 RepID=A0A5N5D4A5_9PEZI|nr:hypothetical protein DBV05_g8912 [Lasiodiplodia theobromae]